jgi:uncharacterized protein
VRRALAMGATVAAIALLGACGDDGGGGDDTPTTTGGAGLANPAAVFCEDSGGVYSLDDGTCTLPDGSVVDGWQYFYEKNPTSSTTG